MYQALIDRLPFVGNGSADRRERLPAAQRKSKLTARNGFRTSCAFMYFARRENH